MYDAAAPSPEAAAPADGSLLKDVMNSVRLATGGGERDRSRRLRHGGVQGGLLTRVCLPYVGCQRKYRGSCKCCSMQDVPAAVPYTGIACPKHQDIM